MSESEWARARPNTDKPGPAGAYRAIEKAPLERRRYAALQLEHPSNDIIPVMGLIFLRHAFSRSFRSKTTSSQSAEAGGKARALAKEDFSRKERHLPAPKAQFDYLVGLTDSDDRAKAIIDAMNP